METLISRFKKLIGDSIRQFSGDNSINNIGDQNINIQINIENVIVNPELFSQLKENYKLFYLWHKENGIEYFIDKVGKDFSREYVDYVNTLRDPGEAEIDDMIDLANQIKNGVMNWSALQEINGKLSSKLAQDILKNKDKVFITKVAAPEDFREDQRYDFTERIIRDIDDDIKEIQDKEYEKDNIGGTVFILQTNIQFNKEVFSKAVIGTPRLLGFERVADPNALVNLALNGDIEIKYVELQKGDDKNNHFVYIEIENLRDYDLEFYIPKGQVFENKDRANKAQNLSSSDSLNEVIPANECLELTIEAYCLNESMELPNESAGNITLFELKNKEFEDGDQLWELLEETWNNLESRKN